MVIWQAQMLFLGAKFWPLCAIKKESYFCWCWTGCGDACRLCSNKGMFQAFALVWQTAQNWRLHKTGGPHKQCLAGISDALSDSFTSTSFFYQWFHSAPNKACLLCATPAGTYWVHPTGFQKIIYCNVLSVNAVWMECHKINSSVYVNVIGK